MPAHRHFISYKIELKKRMLSTLHRFRILTVLAIAALSLDTGSVHAVENAYRVEIEAGAVWQSLNDAQSPAVTTTTLPQGSRFSLKNLQGSGPERFGRLSAGYTWGDRHQIHALYAPLTIAGTGAFSTPVHFQGATFTANVATAGRYKFDSYRIGYRYKLLGKSQWKIWSGATIKVRDANISLAQGPVEVNYADTGVVPLLSLYARRDLSDRWSTILDLEGLAAPQGRAIDAVFKVRYQFGDIIGLNAGYRMLEGGADNRKVYTFAWLHYGLVSLDYDF
jgi:hypothetical protein